MYRDSCVDRENKHRKEFKGNPNDPFRVSFFDMDKIKVDDVTRKEATCVAAAGGGPFYFQDGDGRLRELSIAEVIALTIKDALPSIGGCQTAPEFCGPPFVQLFGGSGVMAAVNAVISPISSSVIAFDIVNAGKNFISPPFANLVDKCGNGSGGALKVQMNGDKIKNIVPLAPGDGYLAAPNGSLGGNGTVWVKPNECYIKKRNGKFKLVKDCNPPPLEPEDRFYPPRPPDPVRTYPVILVIDEIYIEDPGFGYQPGDTIQVVPQDKGAQLEPVINPRGEIEEIIVRNPGVGFLDLPELIIESETGYNARLIPVLKVIPVNEINVQFTPAQLVTVVDCVGKLPPTKTFNVPR